MGWQWHQLDHMQIICILLQTDNHANTSSLIFLQAECFSWCPTNSVKAWKTVMQLHKTSSAICIITSSLKWQVPLNKLSVDEVCAILLLWTGIHFLGNAVPSVMKYTSVSGAGLMDPSLILYSSAIKIDYNVHRLDHLTVEDNLADGVLVIRCLLMYFSRSVIIIWFPLPPSVQWWLPVG